jgi:hypothetical protein
MHINATSATKTRQGNFQFVRRKPVEGKSVLTGSGGVFLVTRGGHRLLGQARQIEIHPRCANGDPGPRCFFDLKTSPRDFNYP